MKLKNQFFTKYMLLIGAVASLSSCEKFLDIEPPSQIIPENYLEEENQLAAYTIARYTELFPSHGNWSYGTFGIDGGTDNMVTPSVNNRYVPGQQRVEASGGEWSFTAIFQANYYLNTVVPKWQAGTIFGTSENIAHYVGEGYFLRAMAYFQKLQTVGDFPILKANMNDSDPEILVQASRRSPRNEVARFILSDLDSAIMLLKVQAPGGRKQRIAKHAALLLKSRVALYEGTWLKYFKGSAFVPNGPEWPGTSKAFTSNYQYPSGGIDQEIDFFLTEAMSSAQVVADEVALVENTGIIESPANENPYFNMFSAVNMSGYSEVLLWREYSQSVVTHNVPVNVQTGNYAVGTTRSMVESFLMENGLPIYASGSGYQGDDFIANVRANRDGRLNLFLKEPNQRNVLLNRGAGNSEVAVEPTPQILATNWEQKYTTGYALRKGLSYDALQLNNGQGYTGSITFRAVEAYLNYIEACYEKNGNIDGKAQGYWIAIRNRAKVDPDYTKTIAATEMSKEAMDWGAYSAGNLINPTLYNIRRERRTELMAEGLRWMDLKRWRAMDQMIQTPYHFEGFKLWGPMKDWYSANALVFGASNSNAIVSDPARSAYLRPLEIQGSSLGYNGARFTMAHYLEPIAALHFILTSADNSAATSVIYQNPGWTTAGGTAPNGF
ncbi:RagB/SusD family nutrient uptake outer membrane protein [Sphingobacterium sp. lm-10]|uniref:RagB/SusD family nutrient uptake outer membrane protein n=1 Tax=Sphingobacterium sp. lm-10 TaxID=2944904 RepID=UPI0020217FA9|nr:RagB/SusD family nutrient uptake outer membrane protein [Sphingobacterium sp. lm-10]MCL7986695.1 RagB/SusD family nutrient uptake outer membrane protein [Sphingobacterium sp. lm-10]